MRDRLQGVGDGVTEDRGWEVRDEEWGIGERGRETVSALSKFC